MGAWRHGSSAAVTDGKNGGGGASDKHTTENYGLLNKLLPGDLVLADRGFDIKDSVEMMCVEVKHIAAFILYKPYLFSTLSIEHKWNTSETISLCEMREAVL